MARKNTNTNNTRNNEVRHKNDYPNNKIEDFGVLNVRWFKDSFGVDSAFFDLELGFILIKGLMLRYTKDGKGYITFQSDNDGKGNYYKRGYINDESLNDAIVEAVENE